MHAQAPDLDTLLSRLRQVAAQHAPPPLEAAVLAQPWAPKGPAAVPPLLREQMLGALPWRQRLALLLVVDSPQFIDALYRSCLGRAPDPEGRAFLQQQLDRRLPRLELWADLLLSAEGQQVRATGPLGRALARLLHRALHPPKLRAGTRYARALLRRAEARWRQHTQASALGLCWQMACWQDAQAQRQHDQQRQLAAQLVPQVAELQRVAAAQADEQAGVATYMAAFEGHFRGTPELLRQQLERDYLPRLHALRAAVGDGACLDLGCGRGVWLDVLREHGFAASGVDLNAQAVQEAQRLGLPAEQGDALEWLQRVPDASALLVTAFHLMEHVPLATRLQLVRECARVLKPGGWLVLETPNPENVWVATHTFYHDATHSQPLTPDSLEFLTQYHGLETVEVLRLHPYPENAKLPGTDAASLRLNGMTCCGQDFAVIAQKPH